MTVFLIVGLPGAGKTTRARELEARRSALRLTPDDWLTAVFAEDGPDGWRSPDRVRQRDRIEGKLVEIGLRAAGLGVDVIFDFGLWSADERSALRWLAASVGAGAEVVYLPVEPAEQRRRITDRSADPQQFAMTDADQAEWRSVFEPPGAAELAGGAIPPVPSPYATWREWAAARWPSFGS